MGSAPSVANSCFFCENLLSDYMEGILPTARHEEIKEHLGGCDRCREILDDIKGTRDLLRQLQPRALSHEMALRVTEASQAGRRRLLTRARVAGFMLFLAVPALLFGAAVLTFPKLFPWFTRFRASNDESQFVRYFPLLQGGAESVEEQASWLQLREPMLRSVWEEGGLSPEEFEKTFQMKGSGGAAPAQPKETKEEK